MTTTQAPAPTNLPVPSPSAVPASYELPPAPLAIAGSHSQKPAQGKYPAWVYWSMGGLAALQLFGSYEVKPTTVVGGVMADWVRQTTSASVENQLLLAKSQQIATFIAETEASYSHKNGQCELTILFGPEAVTLCKTAVDQYHKPALRDARERLAEIEAQLRRR